MRKIPRELKQTLETKIGSVSVTSSNIDLVIDWLMDRWQVIPGTESWKRTGKRFCLFDSLHRPEQFSVNQDKAEQELVMQYIKSYGPVQIEDIAWWCDLTVKRTGSILETFKKGLIEFVYSENEDKYYISHEEYNQFLTYDGSVVEICCLLGKNDPLFTGYSINDPIVPAEYARDVFPEFSQAAPVVLIGGKAAGLWSFKETSGKIMISVLLFKKIGAKLEDRLCFEIDSLGDFLGGEDKLTEVNIEYR